MKIVLTGMGAVCAAGAGVPRFVHATDGWRTALQPGTRFAPPPLPTFQVGQVPDDALSGEADDDRAVRIALPAVVEALKSARLRPGEAQRRVDLFFVGTSLGGMNTAQALQRATLAKRARGDAPPAVAAPAASGPAWMQGGYHGPAATLAARLHLRAHVATYNATCSSGIVALSLACEPSAAARPRLASWAPSTRSARSSTPASTRSALASGLSAPLRRRSTGLLAEGAGFLVIESEESAEGDAVPSPNPQRLDHQQKRTT
jgi:3-oxoacyl-(acyl-carrier-protein) synthase